MILQHKKGGIIIPDFTMCVSTLCHRKEECYRFKALASQRQSYANFYEDIPIGKPLCKHFAEIIRGDSLSNS